MRDKALRGGLVAVLLLGAALRTVQYLARTSFWYDELALVLNVDRRTLAELLGRPLDDQQLAPLGFLAALKAASAVLGVNELGLRLVPWLCALAGLVLAWRVARRVLGGPATLGLLLLFAVSPALTWYGSDVKPYSGDVAASLLLALVGLRFVERPDDRTRALTGGIAGAAAMLLSYPAVPTAAVMGLVLVAWWLTRRPRPPAGPLIRLGLGWTAGALLAGALALRQAEPATRAYMARFWASGFPPALSSGVGAWGWAPRHVVNASAQFLFFILAEVPVLKAFVLGCGALALVGLAWRLKAEPWPALLILAPTLAAVLAAYARLMPFQDRLGLYAGWPPFVFLMAALQELHARLPGRMRWAAAALGVAVAILPAAFVLSFVRPPYHAQETRLVLGALAERWRPGDALYVYYGARHAMDFYGRRLGFSEWTAGECHREDPRAYFREADRLRGRARVWFFHTHGARGYREPDVIRSYLGTIGTERDRIPDPFGSRDQLEAAAYLYDLSDPHRLAAATAETHAFPEIRTGELRTLCDGTQAAGE